MNIQSWMIKSWAMLEWYLPPGSEHQLAFHQVGTHLRDDGSDSGLRAGDAVWVAQHEQWCAGLAWEWAEVRPGIVMLTDPNSIITNLLFVDEDRRPLPRLLKTVAVNRLVHALPWQQAVRATLQLHQPQPGLTAVIDLAPTVPHRTMPPGVTASDFRLLGYGVGPSVPADTPLLRAPSAPSRMVAIEPIRRIRTRANDREAGIDSLPPLRDLRHAA